MGTVTRNSLFECPKCSGKKVISAFAHVLGGVCFRCKGAGFLTARPAAKGELFPLSFLDRETGERRLICHIRARSAAEAIQKGNARINTANFVAGSAELHVVERALAAGEEMT